MLLPITSGKQRAVLASLLVRANQAVTADEIIELVWAEPPPSARATLHNYVKRLRQGLAAIGQQRILTRTSGYLIEIAVGELDVTTFSLGCAAGHTAASSGAWAQASAHWASAMTLWRGRPFADVPSEALASGEGRRLEEMRWQALEAWLDVDLRLGRHARVATEARQLAAAEPLRERLHECLMLALYRSGQRAEALTVYRDARQFLITEIGIEPGPALRRLHHRILVASPELEVSLYAG